ncbi:2'-5' RNA ligase family protein [Streptomyces griseiscabiei]|uniref:2'-5' RNA ligase family protein n=1 Tax=Streptomyces griseiscabiei TaxID=2993540 RepID=A0ABU4KY18_9ACTN|nr:2'-5' RNA ligase family protein [Streptomyces griseiscabiei]MBZ3904500.1 2'-5' RNA ligase family protein [Streptomyces griseiscabiei]MDX2908249.1 2'-5' RNA ligase family protein [Streptomyces griseiscabiei]
MKAFTPAFRGQEWESGAGAFHLYVRPEGADTAFHDLVAACREALGGYPVWCVPDDLVHITVEMDASAPSSDISAAERTRLITALKDALKHIEPFTVLCGSPLANRAGVVLDTHPDQSLVALRNLARRALWEARATSAIAHEGARAHASVGYAYGSADSDPLQSTLRRISPSHALLTVSRLHLLDVRWTAHPRADGGVRWEMDWDPVAVLPLGAS